MNYGLKSSYLSVPQEDIKWALNWYSLSKRPKRFEGVSMRFTYYSNLHIWSESFFWWLPAVCLGK